MAELVDRARSLAEPVGHRRVLRQLDALTARRCRDAERGRRDGLTARETEVLRLLGEGLSNRDIAGRLVISENTAANHVRQHPGQDRLGQPHPGGDLRRGAGPAVVTCGAGQTGAFDPSAWIMSVTSTMTSAGRPARLRGARRIASADGASYRQ